MSATLSPSVTAQDCEVTVPEWSPRGSATTARPRIAVTLTSSCGTAIDVESVRMTVDEKRVTPTTEGSGATVMVVYLPASALIEEADHTVTVAAQDEKGVAGERTWTFHVPDTYLR